MTLWAQFGHFHLGVYSLLWPAVLDINGCVLSYFEGTANLHLHLFTFTFMHLADAFIQSDLHCIEVTGFTFYQLLLSLGIEPMILALLAPCSTI